MRLNACTQKPLLTSPLIFFSTRTSSFIDFMLFMSTHSQYLEHIDS